jgi:HD-GYP domain-containing protein (c-di-GMP phosphodiesterase class II)/HAMP domain-containing protein
MSGADKKDPRPANPGLRTESLARKLILAFSAMFVVPILIAIYFFVETAGGVTRDSTQLAILGTSVVLLGTAGFLVILSVVRTFLRASRDSEAIAAGNISRRLSTDAASEISELANNFNRITSRLQQTVDNLQNSRSQMQMLLSHVCATGSQPGDMTGLFDVFLKTLLSLTGLQAGAIFLVSPDGKVLRIRFSIGLSEAMKATVIPFGDGIVGWAASHGQMVTISESMPWEKGGLTEFEKSMPWALHIPMTSSGRTRGVVSIGLRDGQKEVEGDDIQMIQNLANQVAVTLENAELKRRDEKTYIETVAALAAAVEARDRYTRGHSRRVTELSVEIARRMGKPEWFVKDLESAALLHDIGKIGFPDQILCNPGPLPPDGVRVIQEHPLGGENILKPVGSLARLCPIVRHHHERFNGNGYPDGLKGEEIPIAARIITVADSFDAMISARPYKAPRSREDAIGELLRCRGMQFDPSCVDTFVDFLRERSDVGLPVPA